MLRPDTGNDGGGGVSALRALRFMLLVLVCCLVPAIFPGVCGADPDNQPIVVVRIDDCSPTWNTPFIGLGDGNGSMVTGLDYGKLKHIPITWAVITNFASSGSSLTWDQLGSYLSVAGGELASHSVNHDAMPSQQAYIDELINSKAALLAHGYPGKTFLQPGGWTLDAYMDIFTELDNPIGQAIQANYSQSMAYLGGGWRIGNPYYRYGVTVTTSLDSPNNPSVNSLRSILDVVGNTPGLVYILTGHGVQEQGQTGTYKVPADVLKATMDKLADLRDQGKIRLMGIDDAFQASFPSNLNHIPDPGFELTDPIAAIPWALTAQAQFVSTGGVDNSRYCSLPNTSSKVVSPNLSLSPGRYELSWYQRLLPEMANGSLAVALTTCTQNYLIHQASIDYALIYNTSLTAWEKRSALFMVSERLNISQLLFQPTPNSGYDVDSVSILEAPLDPAISPTETNASPGLNQCTLTWNTPSNASWTGIVIRYDRRTHPLTPTSGTAFGAKVTAVPGTTQQLTASIDWSLIPTVHFSIFAVDNAGNYSPPDLAAPFTDAPPAPQLSITLVPIMTADALWVCTSPVSIIESRYAIGSSPGATDVIPWTATTLNQAHISNITATGNLYISVKCENAYGRWSPVTSNKIFLPASVNDFMTQPNGTPGTFAGVITAVFSDCYYVQSPMRIRGLKVLGHTASSEGQTVQVTGTIYSSNGERYIDTGL